MYIVAQKSATGRIEDIHKNKIYIKYDAAIDALISTRAGILLRSGYKVYELKGNNIIEVEL
jgi:hypothetical protein